MTKGNGKNNGHKIEHHEWLSKSHNKELSKMLSKEQINDVMEDDIEQKRIYDDIDRTIEDVKQTIRRLRRKNLLASLSCREES